MIMKYELLRSVAQDIVNGTLKFDMSEWCDTGNHYTADANGNTVLKDAEQTACGTTACLAGWLAIRGGTATLQQVVSAPWDYRVRPDVQDAADDMAYDSWSYAGMKALEIKTDADRDVFDSALFHLPTILALRVLRRIADTEHMTVDGLRTVILQEKEAYYGADD